MYRSLKAMENRLSEDQKDMLKRIWAPTVVAVPLACSRKDLCILPTGEIRSYGKLYANRLTKEKGIDAYLSSVDCGLSWQIHYAQGKMNACTYIEEASIYLKCVDNDPNEEGIFIYSSKIGPDDPNPSITKITDISHNCSFPPIKSAFSNRIWFTSQQGDIESTISFFFSDDFGKTWNLRTVPAPKEFEVVFPHKGLRWCKDSGCEPYAIELSKDKMMMIIRSSTDCFWKCYSYDRGNTWTTPEPSTFYGTDTTPFFLRLSDGRVLLFWNNTKPLSEPNHNVTLPPVSDRVKTGFAEDAFTNRDAAHVAITQDGGESWMGYRELILNGVRNNADFRYTHADRAVQDKSVHQFQAFELPFNKILVSVGQNLSSRKLVIFDVDWLYETSREATFLNGMADITTHTYLKSVSASRFSLHGNGHCSWNRTYSAYMMPDPLGSTFETLSVSKHHDDRLINDIGGMCWNFPMSRQGKVTVRMYLAEKQARFILSDRWYNACDPYAAVLSPFWFELDVTDVKNDYITVTIDYDVDAQMACVSIDDAHFFKVALGNPCPTGISYLIMQCATDGDSKGFYIRSLKKE